MVVRLNGETIGTIALLPEFEETRLDVDGRLFKKASEMNHVTLKLERGGSFEVDHILALSQND